MELFLDVTGIIIESLRRNPGVRAWLTGVCLALVGGSFAAWVISPFVLVPEVAKNVDQIVSVVSVVAGFLAFLGIAAYTGVKVKGGGLIQIELESLREERQTIQERLLEKPKADIIDTIQLNLNQLSEYYVINKSQARNSFRFSVFAVVTGLLTLLAGVWFFYLRATPNIEMTVISGVAGMLVQFIGGAYFYLYRKSLEQLNFFFGQLVKMQDTMLSVKLCEQISSEEKQVALRERIILTLLERSSPALLRGAHEPAET